MELWKYTMGKDGVKVEHKEDANMILCALCGNCSRPHFDPDELEFTYCLPIEDEKKARTEIIKEATNAMNCLTIMMADLKTVMESLVDSYQCDEWIDELENYVNKKGED